MNSSILEMKPYYEYKKFSNYYLEDSFVLHISEFENMLKFDLDVVLRPAHPQYRPAMVGEKYTYSKATLIFEGVTHLNWLSRSTVKFYDANSETDFGNIDEFFFNEVGKYILSGDWGKVLFHALSCEMIIKS